MRQVTGNILHVNGDVEAKKFNKHRIAIKTKSLSYANNISRERWQADPALDQQYSEAWRSLEDVN